MQCVAVLFGWLESQIERHMVLKATRKSRQRAISDPCFGEPAESAIDSQVLLMGHTHTKKEFNAMS